MRTWSPKQSVLYRSGYRAGRHNERPNPYSLTHELYHQGFADGHLHRAVVDMAGIAILLLVMIGLAIFLPEPATSHASPADRLCDACDTHHVSKS